MQWDIPTHAANGADEGVKSDVLQVRPISLLRICLVRLNIFSPMNGKVFADGGVGWMKPFKRMLHFGVPGLKCLTQDLESLKSNQMS